MAKNPLFKALKENNIDKFKEILAAKQVSLDDKNWHDQTPLLMAILESKKPFVEALINAGADLEVRFGEYERTPVHCAAICGYADILKCLLDAKAQINAVDTEQGRALDMTSSVECAQVLLDYGADINACDERGLTPLITAVSWNRMKMVKFFVEQGAKIDLVTHNGNSALCVAAMNSNLPIVQYLLEKGADVNIVNGVGCFPLWYAVDQKNYEMVKLMCAYGVKIDDEKNKKLKECIGGFGRRHIRKYLKSFMENPDVPKQDYMQMLIHKIIDLPDEELKQIRQNNYEPLQQLINMGQLFSLFQKASYDQQRTLYPVVRHQMTSDTRQKIERLMRENRTNGKEG